MTTLRVLVVAPSSPDRAEAWSLFDAAGLCIKSGFDLPEAWPRADRIELVLAASVVRLAIVALPPLPAARLTAAVRFELEDRLAGPANADHLAVSPQAPDGRVKVAIAARALIERVAAATPDVARIVAEPDLAPPLAGWRWCAATAEIGGFIRCSDGSAFPVDPPSAAGALPSELALALTQVRLNGGAPAELRVEADCPDAWLARWTRETGIAFVGLPPWRWQDAEPATFAAAIDLLPPTSSASAAPTKRLYAGLFKPAMWLAAAALALHVTASIADWATLAIGQWRDEREWRALAAAIGVAPEATATAVSARAALSRRYAELRHERGLTVGDDALPLLARIVPALGALPTGALRSAAYADRHWTLDLAAVDAGAIRDLDLRLRAAGLPAIVATGPNGIRVRIGEL